MTLSPPAPSGRGLKPVNSVNYEPTAARILGPNHYQIRDHDVKYRLLKLSFTFGGQFDQCPQYKHELMLDSPVFLQFRQALIQLGAENSWALIYELNAFRSGHTDAHFRPWLLSGLTRDDIIKQDTMTRFFVPRTLRVSYSLLANIALVQQDVITRKIKGSHHSLIE
ncbi:hypothetical protein PhCBS80983_g00368 [Powellomyces hirtus]|uniref:Uncharacterized protein n=1 Tax=Powellomyces hirtus TaxID=109895 RepID=A0A507EH00_9FUNG|nr:hypothetical protein PhCBS80983_g00368 [Powellomyces hirtus]